MHSVHRPQIWVLSEHGELRSQRQPTHNRRSVLIPNTPEALPLNRVLYIDRQIKYMQGLASSTPYLGAACAATLVGGTCRILGTMLMPNSASSDLDCRHRMSRALAFSPSISWSSSHHQIIADERSTQSNQLSYRSRSRMIVKVDRQTRDGAMDTRSLKSELAIHNSHLSSACYLLPIHGA